MPALRTTLVASMVIVASALFSKKKTPEAAPDEPIIEVLKGKLAAVLEAAPYSHVAAFFAGVVCTWVYVLVTNVSLLDSNPFLFNSDILGKLGKVEEEKHTIQARRLA